MPAITFDARGFSIAGRRRLLLAGDVEYARLPIDRWGPTLDALRDAGLSAAVVPTPWAAHEPARGRFDFEGSLNVRQFLELAHERDLLCLLRPGPFIGPPWDMGALPAWLLDEEEIALRGPSPAFLGACARWFTALFEQVRDLQATATPPGPIALVQNEHEWFCGGDSVGVAYVNELHRYLRESGVSAPIISANNLYHSVESAIDGWVGQEDLHATLRQMRSLTSDRPLLALDLGRAWHPAWREGKRASDALDGERLTREIAQALSAGGHVAIRGFSGGSIRPRLAGRNDEPGEVGFVTASDDAAALVREGGAAHPAIAPVRRICRFATAFERLFTSLDHTSLTASVVATPVEAPASVAHAGGAQGAVAFVFSHAGQRAAIPITLPNGASDVVDTGDMGVAWRVLDYRLTPHATLDYCGANALLHMGDLLVCFAPAGSEARIEINGVRLDAVAPTGKTPIVEHVEGVTVALLNEEQADALRKAPDEGVLVGADRIAPGGELIAATGFKQAYTIQAGGDAQRAAAQSAPRPPRAPALTGWARADTDAYISGQSERFARMDGPAPMERLGAPHDYLWIRVEISAASARKAHAALFEAGDRALVFASGAAVGVAGVGPGGEGDTLDLSLKKGGNTVVILAEALGRSGLDPAPAQRRGVYGHLHDAEPVKALKPTIEVGEPISPLDIRAPLWRIHESDCTDAQWITWVFEQRKKLPALVRIEAPQATDAGVRGVALINGEPIDFVDDVGPQRLVIEPDRLKRGRNVLQLAPLGDAEAALDEAARRLRIWVSQANLTEKSAWAAARWEPPEAGAFAAVAKSAMGKPTGAPVWWRCQFKARRLDTPLLFDAAGLTKGQIILNGEAVCRYWTSTRAGKAVEGQRRFTLPASMLREGGENELLLFDEHGAGPARCKLVYDPWGPPGAP